MNIITELEIQKKDKNRVNIFLDGNFAFGLDIMAAASLSCGQKLSGDEINTLKSEDKFKRALNTGVRFLGRRARSIKEMETYLIGKDYPEKTINAVIEKLLEKKYLDDHAFARMWIESRNRFNPKGAFALRYELRHKGVDESIIETALSEHDDNRAAWEAVEKKLSQWKSLGRETLQKKLYTFLSGRGFNYETTTDTYNRVMETIQAE